MGQERSKIGRNLFSSINAFFNISKSAKIKLNVDYKNENLERESFNQINYVNNSEENVDALYVLNKKPTLIIPKLGITKKLSQYGQLEAESRFSLYDLNQLNNSQINGNEQESDLKSTLKNYQQIFKYTNRFSDSKALLSSLVLNYTESPQELIITPDNRLEGASRQTTNISTYRLFFKNELFIAPEKSNIKVAFGYLYQKSTLQSRLLFQDNEDIISSNNVDFIKNYPWLQLEYFKKIDKWRFKLFIESRLSLNSLEIKDINNSDKDFDFLVLPEVKVSYIINKIQSLSFTSKYNQEFLGVNNFYVNPIFNSITSATQNSVNQNTLNRYNARLLYRYYDFFNLFQYSLGVSYSKNLNGINSNTDINGPFTTSTRILNDLSSSSISLSSNLDTYVRFLKSNIKINYSFNNNRYNNFINNSEVRANNSTNHNVSLNFKSGFLGILNFENFTQYNLSLIHI